MSTPSRDDVFRVASECRLGVTLSHDGEKGQFIEGANWTDELERFAAAMYAAGAEDMRKRAVTAGDAACDAINTDNDWGDGVMAGASAYRNTIRALPITPANGDQS